MTPLDLDVLQAKVARQGASLAALPGHRPATTGSTAMRTGTIVGRDKVLRNITDLSSNQIPFAVARALTETAKAVAKAEAVGVDQAFDRPTPFTRRAFSYTMADKRILVATVFAKDAQAKYLLLQVEGGTRGFKTFEEKFALGDTPKVALPAAGIRLNQYGNISRAQILKIARDLNTSGKARRFFKGKPKGSNLPVGIYARVNRNTGIQPLIVFATHAQYRKRFAFSAIAEETVDQVFEQNLRQSWDRALKSAR